MMMKKRNIGQEILEGIREIKAGKGKKYKVEVPKVNAPETVVPALDAGIGEEYI